MARKSVHRLPDHVPHPALAELEAERKLVKANRELIARMEAKIQAKLAEVWVEDENARRVVQKG